MLLVTSTLQLASYKLHPLVKTFTTFAQFPLLRWGLVPCIVAKHAMSAGEEAFVWYGYDLDFCPDWWAEYSGLEVDLFMISPPGTWMLGSSKPSLFLTPCGRSMDWVDKTSLGMTDGLNMNTCHPGHILQPGVKGQVFWYCELFLPKTTHDLQYCDLWRESYNDF